jgi:AcrR family transcriptional regulator
MPDRLADDRVSDGPIDTFDGPPHPRVADIQRARIVAAMVEVAAERGFGGATVARVVARSAVSRRTFYEFFSDREECFLAAFDDALARIARVLAPAYEQPSKWHEQIRAGLTALLQFLDDEPLMGRLVVVEALGAGPKALERRRRVLAQIITAVDEGRSLTGIPKGHTAGRETKRGDGPSPLTAEGIVGAVFSVVHGRMTACPPPAMGGPRMGEGDRRPLVACPRMGELVNPLMSLIVLPYLGAAAARGELDRPLPERPDRAPAPARIDPLAELGMRLTYRTMRVLLAVGERPGASNRAVGHAAGVEDQGQISKLLARFARLGLIESTSDGAKGAANAWRLTERGEWVLQLVGQG